MTLSSPDAPATALTSQLSLRHLGKTFGGRKVVDDVSLDIAPGHVVCLLGASGSGKSTTLRMVAGIERADEGSIEVGGRVVDGTGPWIPPEKRGVGLVFQDLALFPHLTARQNAAFGLFRLKRSEALARADRLIEMVGLGHLKPAYPHQLSGGEQQRLAVARALATRPQVMLLDEPFSGLDERLRDQVRQDVLGLLRHEGAATLFVTHDPDEAMRAADRIVLLRQGRVAQAGSPSDLFDRPADIHVAAFFSPIGRFHVTAEDGKAATELGTLDATGLGQGVAAILAVRPRDFELADQGLAAMVATVAKASDGLHVAFQPEPGIHDGFGAVFPAETRLSPGEQIRLRLRPGRGFVFPAA